MTLMDTRQFNRNPPGCAVVERSTDRGEDGRPGGLSPQLGHEQFSFVRFHLHHPGCVAGPGGGGGGEIKRPLPLVAPSHDFHFLFFLI